MSEWKRVKLGDIAEIGSSKRIKAADYVSEGVPFYRSKEIIDRHKGNNISTELFISDELFNGIKNKFGAPSTDDILLTSVGTLGVPYMVKPEDYFYFKDGNLTWFKNYSEDIYPLYLYFWLCSPVAKSAFKEVTIGSTQQALTIVALKSIEIDLPPIEEQKKIAENIKIISDKISNNTAMNATLEKIAQRIFKSWFIDFDPVKANAESVQFDGLSPEIQALFPNEFEESELGMIPKGWEVTNLGSVSECLDSKRIPLSKIKREQKPGIYPYYGATSLMGFIDEWIFDDIYLLLGEDGSVIKDDKTPFTQYIWGKTWVNNHAHVLKGANGISTEQLMIHVQRANVSEFITGAVQLKINQTNMKRIPFIKASNYINEAFQRIISPLYEKIRLLKDQNDGLIKIRDKLLPRLISGKITIQKAEELLEEAS